MKNRSISILLFVLLTASMLLITGCPRVQNKVPIVNKVSGPSGTITQSSTTFSWTVSNFDGTITKYEYRKDEASWTNHGLNTSYTWSGYSEGPHSFEVRAQDDDGEYSEAASWEFVYNGVRFEEPAMVTSAGQSPGALQFNLLANKAGLDNTFDKLIYPDGFSPEQYGTLIFIVGVSLKGLSVSGVSLEEEIERVSSLAIKAKSYGSDVIVCNIEGESRRGRSSDELTNALSPYADAYFVRSDANEDGFFTDLSEVFNVPLELFDETAGLVDILIRYFNLLIPTNYEHPTEENGS